MSGSAVCVQALGKKLKRRTLKRAQWQLVHHTLREMRHVGERCSHLARIIDRHAPTMYDADPLALRERHLARFASWGRFEAARHMIRVANGRPGVNHVYGGGSPAYSLRGYFHVMPIAKLPDARRAA